MTVTLTKAPIQWGVRHKASPDPVTHVDVRSGRVDAIGWRDRLHWCGNRDAQLVWRRRGGSWHVAIPVQQVRGEVR